MVTKGWQHAVLNGLYWVFRYYSYSPYGKVPAKAALHNKQKPVGKDTNTKKIIITLTATYTIIDCDYARD